LTFFLIKKKKIKICESFGAEGIQAKKIPRTYTAVVTSKKATCLSFELNQFDSVVEEISKRS